MLTRKLANIADVTIDLSGRDISAALTTILSRLPWGTLSSPSNALDDYYLGSIYADLVTDNLYQLNHTLTELYRIAHNFPDFNLSGNLLDETGKLSFTCKGTAISISYALDEQARVVNISGDVILDGNAPITIAGQLTEHNLTISCDSPDVRNTLNLTIPSDLFTGLITLNITEIRLHNGKVSSTTAWSADLAPERNGFVLSFDADYKNRIYLSYHLYDEQIELSVSDANVSSTLTLTNEQDSLVLAGDFRQPFLIPEPFRLALRLSPAEVTVAPLSDSMTDLEFSALPNLFIRE